jgi:hypothetical protein
MAMEIGDKLDLVVFRESRNELLEVVDNWMDVFQRCLPPAVQINAD